jgi:flagellar biosynthesis protein FliR
MVPSLSSLLPAETWVYALVFARIGAMVATMPVFGETSVPVRARLILALALTLVLAPVSGIAMTGPPPPGQLSVLLIGETLIGLAIGMATRFVMAGVHVAGNVIAAQLGLSMAMSSDPAQNGGQGAIVGNFMSLMALTLIVVTDLHHLLIGAMKHSYTLFPVGGAVSTADMAQWAVQLMAGMFAMAMQMAAPFLVFALVLQFTAGIVSRMMPQVQIFFITVPISILGGFVLLMFSLSAMMMLFLKVFGETVGPMAGS